MRLNTQLFGVVLLTILVVSCDARGGRGGGARGGSRGGSRGSRGSRGVSRGGGYSGRRYGGQTFVVAASAGYIYGWNRYQHRRSYRDRPNNEPSVCKNSYDYRTDNGTSVSYFICPAYDQGNDYNQCCGPSDRQKCCRFWDKPGNVAGVVIGCLVGVAIIGTIIYCCFCRSKPSTKGTVLGMTQVKDPASDPINPAALPAGQPPPGAYVPPSPNPGHVPPANRGAPMYPTQPAGTGPTMYPSQPFPSQPSQPYPPSQPQPPQAPYPAPAADVPYPAQPYGEVMGPSMTGGPPMDGGPPSYPPSTAPPSYPPSTVGSNSPYPGQEPASDLPYPTTAPPAYGNYSTSNA